MSHYLILNGTVIDCTGSKPRTDTAILVEGDRVVGVGPEPELRSLAERGGPYKIIDAGGATIMPGIIDVHVHPSYGDILSFEELDIYTGCEYRTLRAAHNLKKVLRAGVTTICAPGSNWNINVALRDAVNAGMIEGPRISAGGRYITTDNAIAAAFPTHIVHPQSSFGILCNTRDEMIVAVRKQLKEGVDIIKVAGDGDSLTSSGLLAGTITFEDLQAIAELTHMMGRRCTIHARSGQSAAAAARAGFDWVIHASFMTDEDLAVVVKHRTPINPTLSLLANTLDWGRDVGASDGLLDAYKRELDAASRILTKAHREGVVFIAGTDAGQGPVPYGEWHAREMEHLVHYIGMSNAEALLAGTRDAARVIGMGDMVGTIEAGKFADILIVDGNPLADIAVLQDKQRLRLVMKGGEIVDHLQPVPQPRIYRWEKPQLYWNEPQLMTQEFVRSRARAKPAWMSEASSRPGYEPEKIVKIA
jgi:imidazolonepropionase-like amidohydrolase